MKKESNVFITEKNKAALNEYFEKEYSYKVPLKFQVNQVIQDYLRLLEKKANKKSENTDQ